jgi:hypothetical protein
MEKLRKEDERKKEADSIKIIDWTNEGPMSVNNFIISSFGLELLR